MSKNSSVIPFIREPKIATKTLKNGVEVTIIDVPGAQVGDIRFFFDTGFKDLNPETYHVPHIFEHILMESRTEGKSLQDRVMSYGAETNATTDFDVMTVLMRIPTTFLTNGIEEIVRTLGTVRVTKDLVEREKVVVGRETADQYDGLAAQISSYMYANVLKEFVPSDLDASILSLEEITAERVKAFHKKLFEKCGLRVLVTGEVSPKVKASMIELIETLAARNAYNSLKHVELEKDCASEALPVMDTGALTILNLTSRLENEDEVKLASVAELYVYTRYFSNPQNEGLKRLRDSGLLYSIDVQPGRYGNIADRTYMLTTEATRGREGLLAVLDILFGTLQTKDDEQFKLVKNFAKNSMPLTHETVGEVAEWYATDLTASRAFHHVSDGAKIFADLTPEQVSEHMYRVFTKSKWQIGLAAPAADEVFFVALQTLHKTCRKTESPGECYEAYKTWKKEADKLPQPVEEDGVHVPRGLLSLGAFIALVLSFVPDFIVKAGSNQILSLFDVAALNPIIRVAFIYCLLNLLYLPEGSFRGFWKPALVLSGALSGLVAFLYTIFVLDKGGDDSVAPFWNDIAGTYLFIYFVIGCGAAVFLGLGGIWRAWSQKRVQ